MTKISKSSPPKGAYEGFGAFTAATGSHLFLVEISPGVKDDVSIYEVPEFREGADAVENKRSLAKQGGFFQSNLRVTIPRRFWVAISEVARKDFGSRLKAQKLPSPRWAVGDNKVDRMLGKELCVLAWAVELASSVEECKVIASKWAALSPAERWWLFSQTSAGRCTVEDDVVSKVPDKNVGWRKALYHALSGS